MNPIIYTILSFSTAIIAGMGVALLILGKIRSLFGVILAVVVISASTLLGFYILTEINGGEPCCPKILK